MVANVSEMVMWALKHYWQFSHTISHVHIFQVKSGAKPSPWIFIPSFKTALMDSPLLTCCLCKKSWDYCLWVCFICIRCIRFCLDGCKGKWAQSGARLCHQSTYQTLMCLQLVLVMHCLHQCCSHYHWWAPWTWVDLIWKNDRSANA